MDIEQAIIELVAAHIGSRVPYHGADVNYRADLGLGYQSQYLTNPDMSSLMARTMQNLRGMEFNQSAVELLHKLDTLLTRLTESEFSKGYNVGYNEAEEDNE